MIDDVVTRIAADCGAVGHCSSTVWETKEQEYNHNEISDRFIRLFRQLQDVKDLINEVSCRNNILQILL